MQPVPELRGTYEEGERSLSALFEDVVRSARGVALQSAELAKLELQDGIRGHALGAGLFLVACVFLGVLAALVWGSALGALVWLASDNLGVPAAVLGLGSLHALAAGAAVLAIRSRLNGLRQEQEE